MTVMPRKRGTRRIISADPCESGRDICGVWIAGTPLSETIAPAVSLGRSVMSAGERRRKRPKQMTIVLAEQPSVFATGERRKGSVSSVRVQQNPSAPCASVI